MPSDAKQQPFSGRGFTFVGAGGDCDRARYRPGIVTLYDAVLAALDWYMRSPERRKRLPIKNNDNLKDDKSVFALLVRSRVLDGTFDYRAFNALVERALREEMTDYDYGEIVKGIESVMTQIGVMPFDENKLPPENPATF